MKRIGLLAIALLALSALGVAHVYHGPPSAWPAPARIAVEGFMAPGGFAWLALFWHPFGDGPDWAGKLAIVLVNATVWTLVLLGAARAWRALRGRRQQHP
jgi:hypothetical protein